MKCALIEYTYYHDEVLPTLVYILNALGIHVDIYTSRQIMQRNPFIYSANLNYTLQCTDGRRFWLWESLWRYRGYNFLIVNTMESKEILCRVRKFKRPLIGIMHNADLLRDEQQYRDFFMEHRRKPLVIGRHVSRFLSKIMPARWITPIYLGNVKAKTSTLTHFCVQGNLEFDRRNYDSLIEAVKNLVSEDIRNFRVMIVGRNDLPDGLIFKKRVKSQHLEQFFEFSKGEIPYKEYYATIAAASFILPLLDTSSPIYQPYFSTKITASLSIALGIGIVPVAHEEIARLYGIEELSIRYEDGGLTDALEQALRINEEELKRMKDGLFLKREALLHQSILNIRETLNDLGIPLTSTRIK